jgi:CopA family copper-resistance protein
VLVVDVEEGAMKHSMDHSRRGFVQGLAGSAVAASGILPLRRLVPAAYGATSGTAAVLAGSEFHLEIDQRPVNITGRERLATVVNGQLPGPTLHWREGDQVAIHVTNRLAVPTSIHWHGILVPADMDGVPGVSFSGIAPGTTFTYRFPVKQSGTYWYHSHSGFQEQTGLSGALIIEPRNGGDRRASREHVVLLSDWTDTDPARLYRKLKLHSDYFNFGKRTVGDFIADIRARGWGPTLAERRMWGEMRMSPTDLADVSGYAYTYLVNGLAPTANWTGLFEPGETVRLRCINGASMTFFDVRVPGLKLTVVAADGQDVEPVTVDEFRIGPAEVYDLLLEPTDARAYCIFAQAMDRSGYAAGTLAPRPGMKAEVPAMDSRALLTMVDMGHGMSMTEDVASGHAMPARHDMPSGRDMPSGHDMPSRHDMPPGHDMARMGEMTDMGADRLDDPGVGLRDNGRRVLTYADLHTVGGPLDTREPSRELVLHLTGNMTRFTWSFDDRKFSDSEPLQFHYGERLTLVLINDSMMLHPLHLHGMWGEVYTADGRFRVRKHTITVQPGQRLTYRVTADARGRWAYHCHLLYHMEAGMFREVIVAPEPGS